MKVVLLTTLVPQHRSTGLVHYTSQFANALAKLERVYVIAHKNIKKDYFNDDVNLLTIETPAKYYDPRILLFPLLIKKINSMKPDVIHIQARHPWFFLTLPFLGGYPIVYTAHDPLPRVEGEKPFLWEITHKKIMERSDKIIVHGKKMKEVLIKKGLQDDNIEIVPHGAYDFYTRWKRDETVGENSVLFFGRIERYKGLEYLIDSAKEVVEQFSDVKFIIAGEGDFRSYERQISRSYKKNFEVHNEFIPDEEVAKLFQRAKVIALPYIEGTQSGVVSIAYAFRKPVVVTNVGSIPEVVEDGETGFVVPAKDSKALAKAIITILKDDSLRRKMGENGYKKIERELSWEIVVKSTLRIYKELVEGQ